MSGIDHNIAALLAERTQIRQRNREIARLLKALRMQKRRAAGDNEVPLDNLDDYFAE